MKYNVAETLDISELVKLFFFIRKFSCLNFFGFKPMSSAGSIPTSDKTEYLPPMKLL